MRSWPVAMAALWIGSTSASFGASAPAGDLATQTIMHSIFGPISTALPLSFDDRVFRSPENSATITAALKQLRDNAGALRLHAVGKDRAFEYVAKSLQSDATQLYRFFSRGAYDEAQFTLHNMTDNCIACHANLPENHRAPTADAFFKAVKADSLHPLERAQFYVMSRQFDDALRTYEAYFKQSEFPASSLTTLGSFVDYLKVCINVKQDLARPRRLVEAVAQRPDIDIATRAQLKRWSTALGALETQGALAKSGIADARAILNTGRDHMEYLRDRDGVAYYLVAAAILSRYVHNHPDHGKDVGEAYYMLGITESLLGHSFWISRSEFYLESAIRLAPAAAFAPKAYALLEESYTVNYQGSGGTHVPDDVKLLLGELRQILVEAQRGKA